MKFIYQNNIDNTDLKSNNLGTFIEGNKEALSKQEKVCMICDKVFNKDISRYISEYFINEYDKIFKYITSMEEFFNADKKAKLMSKFLGLKEISHDEDNVVLRLNSTMRIIFAISDNGLFLNKEDITNMNKDDNTNLILAYDNEVFRYIITTDGICLSNLDDALKYMKK